MLRKLKIDVIKNKHLVYNLNKKYLGFTKVRLQKNKKYKFYNPNKEYLPFEYEYQAMYKERYLKQLKIPKLLDLSILNLSKSINKEQIASNKLLITETEKPKAIKSRHNKTESNLSSNKLILKTIFKNEEEKKIYNNLPFFSLFKKDINNGNNRIKEKYSEEDFLYKLSHNKTEYNNKNLYIYNSTKFKDRYKGQFNISDSNEIPELKLRIKNVTPVDLKTNILSTKERHLNLISKQISLLKSIPDNLMNNINDILNSVDYENGQEKTEIRPIDKNTNNSFNIIDEKSNNNIKIKKISFHKNLNNERAKTYNSINYNINKKLKKYPLNFYSLQQLIAKKKKYEKRHKEAYKDFQSKINLTEDYKQRLNYRDEDDKINRPLTLGVLRPSRNIFKMRKVDSRLSYFHLSKIRDIIIAKKLRCEFDSDDIKRILNGQKPWKNKKDKNEDGHV